MAKFSIIEDEIFEKLADAVAENKITTGDAFEALMIARYKNWKTKQCNPSIETLAKDRRYKDIRGIKAQVKRLKNAGIISVKSGGRMKGGINVSNSYTFLIDEAEKVEEVAPEELVVDLRKEQKDENFDWEKFCRDAFTCCRNPHDEYKNIPEEPYMKAAAEYVSQLKSFIGINENDKRKRATLTGVLEIYDNLKGV